MKISDTKNIDIKRVKKRLNALDNALEQCESFKEQKEVIIQAYQNKTIQRDVLVRRKLQIENATKYGFGTIVFNSFHTVIAFAFGQVTMAFEEKSKYLLLSFIFAAIFIKDYVHQVKKRFQEPEISMYEIRNLELKFLNAVLSGEKEEVDVPALTNELSQRPATEVTSVHM